MEWTWTILIGGLSIVTLLIWVVFAMISKRNVEKRKVDPTVERSTLATDKSSTGVPPDV
jgi:hypothetical protein